MKRRISSGFGSKIYIRMAPLPFLGGEHASSFIFVILAFAALIFSSVNPGRLAGIRSNVSDAFAPLLSSVSLPSQDALSFIGNFAGLGEMQAENNRLNQENARLREWYQTALRLQNENNSLKSLLNLKIEARHNFITARVLADSSNTFVKNILVLAGRRDGVDKDQAVISGEGLVGRIIDTGAATARVLLVTDINSRVPVIIEGTQQQAILAGQNDDFPVLMHIPSDNKIPAGSRVITSGLGGIFTPGLPVGQIMIDETGDYRVRLFADFDRMMHVKIVSQPEDPNLYRADEQDRLD